MKSRTINRLLLTGIGILLAALVFVLASSLNERVVKEGDTAPDFTVKADDGRMLTRASFGGNLLVLNFWASWCPPCIEELPSLNDLQRKFSSRGLVVLGVSIDKDPMAYQRFLKKTPVAFETALEGENRINLQYGTFKIPETYIIDRSGHVLKKVIGAEKWDDPRVIDYVQSLLQQG